MMALLLLASVFAGTARWQVDRWTMRDGLPQNTVTDLVQARDGHIWMTTFGGIARFDGINFRHFTPTNTPGLDANRFVALAESADGTLWFAGEGSGVYRMRDGQFERLGVDRPVRDLAVDSEGRVWGAARNAFVELSANPPRFVVVDHGLLLNLEPLESGQVVGSGFQMPPTCPTPPTHCIHAPAHPDAGSFQRVGQTTDGRFWLTGTHGAFTFESGHWLERIRHERREPTIGFSLIWNEQPLWIHAGRVQPADELPPIDSHVRSFTIDSEGGLWLGLDGDGLIRVHREPVRLHFAPQAIGSVARDAAGAIWAGSCRGLHIVGAPLPAPPPGHLRQPCISVWSGHRGEVYSTALNEETRQTAIVRTEHGTSTVVGHRSKKPMRAMHIPHTGPWFESDGVLYHIPAGGRAEAVTSATELGGETLRPLRSDGPGEVWVAVDRRYIVRLVDGVPARTIRLPEEATVRDVYEGTDALWMSTYDRGLLGVTDEGIRTIAEDRGMCDHALSRIFAPGDGTLWFNTNRGVGRVVERELWRALQDPATRVHCVPINSGEANGQSGVLAPDGTLWVPTLDGLAEVDTRRAIAANPPRIVLREATHNGVDLLTGRLLEHTIEPQLLSVGFTGIQYSDPRGLSFQYRIIGIDDTWSNPTSTRELHWYLTPGHYRFEVRAIDRSGLTSKPAAVSFVREPRLRETVAYRIGLPLVLTGGIVLVSWAALGITRRNNRALQAQIRIREQVESDLRDEQREREYAQHALAETQRLNAVGRLANGIAHDFNNLLLIVTSHASQLQDHGDPMIREVSGSLLRTVSRAVTLTRRLLVLGGQAPQRPEVMELGAALQRFLPLLRRLIREEVSLSLTVREPVWVEVDAARLDQIVTNLIVNAQDAITRHGRVRVIVGIRSDDWAELTVQDTGAGIPPDQLAHIFEPYFTTKGPGQGTGLGLATVHTAVREAGGHIEVDSNLGGGTKMTVLLPRVEPAPTADMEYPPVPAVPKVPDGLQVLVVDDQPDVARSLGRLVRSLGWVSHLAGTASEAIGVLDSKPIDIVITDVVMPGASGHDVIAEGRARRPELHVLLMSGHADPFPDTSDEELQDVPLLRKPFTRDDLASAVAEVLRQQ